MKTMREWRNEQGWTPAEASIKIGVSVATIYNWEAGKTEPKASQFRRMASVYGVSMMDIALPEDTKNRHPDESK